MKNILLITTLTGMLLAISACKNQNCKGVTTYTPVNTQLTGYIFKEGTYWVYDDTVDGIIDSQYVYGYTYREHYRWDTPTLYYQVISPGGYLSNVYCGPYYADSLAMRYISYRNGTFADTLELQAETNALYPPLYIVEHYNQPNQDGSVCFFLGYSSIGLLSLNVNPPADTSALWYKGEQSNIIAGGAIFNNVFIWGIQIGTPRSTRFIYPTDLYFATGYGIVKIVEHRPSGDVPWVLLRYHIIS